MADPHHLQSQVFGKERLIVTAELVSGPNADYVQHLDDLAVSPA